MFDSRRMSTLRLNRAAPRALAFPVIFFVFLYSRGRTLYRSAFVSSGVDRFPDRSCPKWSCVVAGVPTAAVLSLYLFFIRCRSRGWYVYRGVLALPAIASPSGR